MTIVSTAICGYKGGFTRTQILSGGERLFCLCCDSSLTCTDARHHYSRRQSRATQLNFSHSPTLLYRKK